MPIYASTFSTGLEPLIKECLPRMLRGCQIYDIYNGLIVYRFDGKPEMLGRVTIFANTYLVLMRQNNPTFSSMVKMAGTKADPSYANRMRAGQSFRIRFQKNGKLEHVDRQTHEMAEQIIRKRSRVKIDRENPDWEFWYIIRSENIGMYCMLLTRREQTEKNLPQGTLRPEFAQCLCLYANTRANDTILDPFAGHGAIPEQLVKTRKYASVLMGDSDKNMVKQLRRKFSEHINAEYVSVYEWDARDMSALESESIDRIITDPPWGIYDSEQYPNIIAFYSDVMCEFMRVLKPGGMLVMLSAAKMETMRTAAEAGMLPNGRMDVLVNGKKAAIFRYRKPFSERRRNG